jgi:selenide,water dikinase
VSALALVQVPQGPERAVEEELFQIMSGCARELREARVALAGGHSVQGTEAAFGLAVQGTGYPQRLRGKSGLRPGEHLVLTQALGTGTILAALAQGKARGEWVEAAIAGMLVSNAKASDILRAAGIQACTDVTGFGLVGHLLEMLQASGVRARLRFAAIPLLEGAAECFREGVLSTLDPDNRRLGSAIASWGGVARRPESAALFDPQTSGGLLFSCAADRSGELVRALRDAGYERAAVIGEVLGEVPSDEPARIELEEGE